MDCIKGVTALFTTSKLIRMSYEENILCFAYIENNERQ